MNIERTLIEWGESHLPYPVCLGVQPDSEEEFVTVERVGGGDDAHGAIDRPTVAVQCWAATRERAAEMAYEVDARMQGLCSDVGGVTDVSRNSFYLFDGPDGDPRYQMVYDMTTQF